MAAISFSMSRNGDAIDNLSAGAQTVTEGTSAPGAGDIEIRLADPASVPWTKREIEQALETMWRFLTDPGRSTSIAL